MQFFKKNNARRLSRKRVFNIQQKKATFDAWFEDDALWEESATSESTVAEPAASEQIARKLDVPNDDMQPAIQRIVGEVTKNAQRFSMAHNRLSVNLDVEKFTSPVTAQTGQNSPRRERGMVDEEQHSFGTNTQNDLVNLTVQVKVINSLIDEMNDLQMWAKATDTTKLISKLQFRNVRDIYIRRSNTYFGIYGVRRLHAFL